MDAADCFSAMLSHHLQKARQKQQQPGNEHDVYGQKTSIHEPSRNQECIAALVSGESIERQFSETAAHRLQPHELIALVDFFRASSHHPGIKNLHKDNLLTQLETFYDTETALSSQDRSRLAKPSGSENADLGLILHVQSRDGGATAFWDIDSPTIQLLQDKGLRSSMLFGFDWHWRAESTTDRHKPQCPATGWPKGVRQLHDEFSTGLARALPLPFLVIAGSCATKSFAKSISSSAKLVELTIAPPDGKVLIWLEFCPGGASMNRFTVFVEHPASMFYAKPKILRQSIVCLDAGLNLVLWLLGISHDAAYFLKQGSMCHYTRWGPHGLERGLKGAPLAELHAYRKRELREKKFLTLSDYSDAFLAWAGPYLGEVPASILEQNMSLVATIQSRISTKISESNRRRTRDATDRQIPKKTGQESVVQQSCVNRLSATDESSHKLVPAIDLPTPLAAGISFTTEQIEKTLIWLSERSEAAEGNSDKKAVFTHLSPQELLSMEYELAVAEVLYMRRLHNLSKSITSEEREKKIASMKNALRVKFHGIRKRYKVSTRPRRATKSHASQNTDVRIIEVEKPTRLTHNEGAQRVQQTRNGAASRATAPRRSLQEWRTVLLKGASFQCITTHSRLRIRLPFLLNAKVPSDAHPEGVFLQCHLVKAGSEHDYYFALDTTSGDRARRLGIRIQYRRRNSVSGEACTSWVTARGIENSRKAKALVDLLDEQESGCQDTTQPRLVNAKPYNSAESVSDSPNHQEGYNLEANYRYVHGMLASTMSVRPQDLHARRGRHFTMSDDIESMTSDSTGG